AGEDDGPDAVVLVELPGDGQDFIAEHSVQGIELVGPVQRHHGNPVPPLEQQVGVGHERRTRLERRNRPMPMTSSTAPATAQNASPLMPEPPSTLIPCKNQTAPTRQSTTPMINRARMAGSLSSGRATSRR